VGRFLGIAALPRHHGASSHVIPQTNNEPQGLRHYLQVLRRRWMVVFLCLAAVVGSALGVSLLQDKVYDASADLLLQPSQSEFLFDQSGQVITQPQRELGNEVKVLKSVSVRKLVEEKIGGAPRISTHTAADNDVIRITARNRVPKQAALAANTYANAYIEYRRNQAVADLVAASEQIQGQITKLEGDIKGIEDQINQGTPVQRELRTAELGPRRDALIEQQTLFRQKFDQLQVDVGLRSGGARLVSPAEVPTVPAEPQPVRAGFLAGIIGLILGVGLAFLFEYLDDSIKSKEDVDQVVPDLPVLGLIPAMKDWRQRDRPLLVSATDPSSPGAEAYRSLRTSVQFLSLDRPVRIIQVTSPNAREGKTTTLSNLAIALASAGQRVVVVCCDLRRPRVHEFFGLSNEIGFTSVLLGEVAMSRALQPIPDQPGLHLLASGPPPPNPSELLSSQRTREALGVLAAQADIVLLDCPPVLPVTDAAIISKYADATLLVATAGVTHKRELVRAYELLRQVNAPLVGSVLNGITRESSYGYTYDRYTPEKKSRRAKAVRTGNGAGDKQQQQPKQPPRPKSGTRR
jgi:capsular exopolysaccharide synthesis family protein